MGRAHPVKAANVIARAERERNAARLRNAYAIVVDEKRKELAALGFEHIGPWRQIREASGSKLWSQLHRDAPREEAAVGDRRKSFRKREVWILAWAQPAFLAWRDDLERTDDGAGWRAVARAVLRDPELGAAISAALRLGGREAVQAILRELKPEGFRTLGKT